MLHTLAFYLHDLNPIIFSLGPITPRWYGFAYLLGFLGAYLLLQRLSRVGMLRLAPVKVPDLVLNGCIFGVLVGGRLGYILFYDLPNALAEHRVPLLWSFSGDFPFWGLLRVNQGGMSAHGGIVFSILTLIIFARKQKVSILNIGDAACMVVPIGLFFGRIANFINGELYGHATTLAWAVKFPSEIWAPTNGVDTITPESLLPMQQAVATEIAAHSTAMSVQNISDFLGNHPAFSAALQQQLGSLDLHSPTQLTAIQEAIANFITRDPNQLGPWDLANLWQHGTLAVHQIMHGFMDTLLTARHPSQLYEALLEGVALFTIVWCVGWFWRKDGMAGGAFLTAYPIMRIIGEQFRVGDTPAHFFGMEISKGVLYSLLMLIPAIAFWIICIKRSKTNVWVPAVDVPVAATPVASPEASA